LQFAVKNFDSIVPYLSDKHSNFVEIIKKFALFMAKNKTKTTDEIVVLHKKDFPDELSENDYSLFINFIKGVGRVSDLYLHFKIKDAVSATMNLARLSNKYFNDEQP